MADDDTPTEEPRQTFGEWIVEQRRGAFHGELTEGFHELLAAVRDQHKGGSMTITIDVKPAGKRSEQGAVVVSETVKIKTPQPERPEAFYFITDDATLSRDNPRQARLPDTGTEPVRLASVPDDDPQEATS